MRPESSSQSSYSASSSSIDNISSNGSQVKESVENSVLVDENDPASTSFKDFNSNLHTLRPSFEDYPKDPIKGKFSPDYYAQYSWLEYRNSKNATFCFVCRYFGKNNSNVENTFTLTGFKNLRKASNRYKENHNCSSHKTSTELYLNRLAFVEKGSQTISSQLDSQHKKIVEGNRSYLTMIIEMTLWLCKQGLAFRGHNETEISNNRGNSNNRVI